MLSLKYFLMMSGIQRKDEHAIKSITDCKYYNKHFKHECSSL